MNLKVFTVNGKMENDKGNYNSKTDGVQFWRSGQSCRFRFLCL